MGSGLDYLRRAVSDAAAEATSAESAAVSGCPSARSNTMIAAGAAAAGNAFCCRFWACTDW